MEAELISHLLKLWHPGTKERKMAAKKGRCFCKRTMNSLFFVTGRIGIKFGKKRNSCNVDINH